MADSWLNSCHLGVQKVRKRDQSLAQRWAHTCAQKLRRVYVRVWPNSEPESLHINPPAQSPLVLQLPASVLDYLRSCETYGNDVGSSAIIWGGLGLLKNV